MEAIVCNVGLRHLVSPGAWVRIGLGKQNRKRSRYRSPIINETLSPVLGSLEALGMVEAVRGDISDKTKQTVMRAGPTLLSKLRVASLTYADFGIDLGAEAIELRKEKGRKTGIANAKVETLEYEDDETTHRYRSEMHTINGGLLSAALGLCPVVAGRADVCTADRTLKRIFTNGSFTQGGRLYGGFWMGLRREDRKAITIDGEPAVSLDYSQAGPRILYGLAGVPYDGRDAYAVPGYAGEYRDSIKKLFGAMLNTKKRLTQFPEELKGAFAGLKVREVVDAVLDHNAEVAHLLFNGVGQTVPFIESQAMVRVLLALREIGVTGLPIHDAVLVPASKVDHARTIMEESFLAVAGVTGRVEVEE
ncbi:hypothetical protein [Cupriavidus sp. H39]|uniref:hypothetical protein n=1 Tax=Cupriavidus sp. H39 TaxID=3401635 RepID=UPI003D01AFC5